MLFICYYFTIFSVLGWMLEAAFRSIRDGRAVNPGFHKGFYLPIYGFGALLILGGDIILGPYNPAFRICYYFISLSALELVTGLAMERIFHVRLWNYNDLLFNIRGRVCLLYSIIWTALAVGLDFGFDFLIPWALRYYERLSPIIDVVLVTITLSIIFEFVIRVSRRLLGRGGRKDENSARVRFDEVTGPLLEHPKVLRLQDFNHHLGKSRLDHVREVAWGSFLVARKLSLDCEAAARGALLHDLFYYDWLHGGPRWHGFRHPNIALKNARRVTVLSKKEEDIIKKHMWPLTVVPPSYPESFVVSMVDKYFSTRDYMNLKKIYKNAKTSAERMQP